MSLYEDIHKAAADVIGESDKIEIYTIEPHSDGYAIYQGRTSKLHGFNLANVSEADLPRMQKLIDRANHDTGE